jgi:hypothetical protein
MRMSQAEYLSWIAIAKVLEVEDEAELDFLPDIADSVSRNLPSIGDQPAAFDPETISLLATALYATVLPYISAALPVVKGVAVDIAKDALKRRIQDWLSHSKATGSEHSEHRSEALRDMHQAIIAAGAKKGLKPSVVSQLADSTIAALAMADALVPSTSEGKHAT